LSSRALTKLKHWRSSGSKKQHSQLKMVSRFESKPRLAPKQNFCDIVREGCEEWYITQSENTPLMRSQNAGFLEHMNALDYCYEEQLQHVQDDDDDVEQVLEDQEEEEGEEEEEQCQQEEEQAQELEVDEASCSNGTNKPQDQKPSRMVISEGEL